MDDLISRREAIDALKNEQAHYAHEDGVEIFYEYNRAIKALKNLPSAQKTGHWIMKEKVYGGLIEDSVYRYECSECGFSDEHNSSREVPFCWQCGARMESD